MTQETRPDNTMPDIVWVDKYPHVKTGQGYNVYECNDHDEYKGTRYVREDLLQPVSDAARQNALAFIEKYGLHGYETWAKGGYEFKAYPWEIEYTIRSCLVQRERPVSTSEDIKNASYDLAVVLHGKFDTPEDCHAFAFEMLDKHKDAVFASLNRPDHTALLKEKDDAFDSMNDFRLQEISVLQSLLTEARDAADWVVEGYQNIIAGKTVRDLDERKERWLKAHKDVTQAIERNAQIEGK